MSPCTTGDEQLLETIARLEARVSSKVAHSTIRGCDGNTIHLYKLGDRVFVNPIILHEDKYTGEAHGLHTDGCHNLARFELRGQLAKYLIAMVNAHQDDPTPSG